MCCNSLFGDKILVILCLYHHGHIVSSKVVALLNTGEHVRHRQAVSIFAMCQFFCGSTVCSLVSSQCQWFLTF